MPDSEMGVFEAIYTQRAIRSFKPDPIPREDLPKIIEAATKAPSGGNTQPWAFIVIQEKEKISTMAGFARHGFGEMYEAAKARMQPGDPDPFPRLKPMVEAFEKIPCLIVVCNVNPPGRTGAGNGASIFPAVQNLLLAARATGIGAALTAGWASRDTEGVKSLLSLPDNVEPVAYIPMGYPDTERYGKTTRRPWAEVTHWDGWEGEKENSATPTHR